MLQHPYYFLMLLGVLSMVALASFPFFAALMLGMNRSYIFWVGPFFVIKMTIATALVVSFFIGTLLVVSKYTAKDEFDSRLMALIVATFSAFLGVIIVMLVLPASKELHDAATHLQHGCAASAGDLSLLLDYNQVLYNIRMTPACFSKRSVEECEGWSENRYTGYLRYLEEELRCGAFCPSNTAPVVGVRQPVLLQQDSSRHHTTHQGGMTQHVVGTEMLSEQSHNPVERTFRLFARGSTSLTCAPLVSTRLRALAFSYCDVVVWEGFALICLSIAIGMVWLCTAGCCVKRVRKG